MNKNRLLRIGAYAGAGALIGFCIDKAIKKHKNNKTEIKKEVDADKKVNVEKVINTGIKTVGIIYSLKIAESIVKRLNEKPVDVRDDDNFMALLDILTKGLDSSFKELDNRVSALEVEYHD